MEALLHRVLPLREAQPAEGDEAAAAESLPEGADAEGELDTLSPKGSQHAGRKRGAASPARQVTGRSMHAAKPWKSDAARAAEATAAAERALVEAVAAQVVSSPERFCSPTQLRLGSGLVALPSLSFVPPPSLDKEVPGLAKPPPPPPKWSVQVRTIECVLKLRGRATGIAWRRHGCAVVSAVDLHEARPRTLSDARPNEPVRVALFIRPL